MSNVSGSPVLAESITEDKLATPVRERLIQAWVNFNGYGTVTINDSYNVSSITDDGTGQYTVNWSTPFTTNDYAISLVGQRAPSGSPALTGITGVTGSSLATTYAKVNFVTAGGAFIDHSNVCVMAIGT